ncbi:hypothetical protein LIER_39279 [Lithospermum erythrorhizon]|uniref:Integrase catalytic domain-containing protein n=1 Tax=Lithospermum erythrorhizon TaxID=34254 RepID=A0AAV3QD85_LITER
MVTSWFLHSVDCEIDESVLYYDTAEKIWNQLQIRYSQSNNARTYQIQHYLAMLSISCVDERPSQVMMADIAKGLLGSSLFQFDPSVNFIAHVNITDNNTELASSCVDISIAQHHNNGNTSQHVNISDVNPNVMCNTIHKHLSSSDSMVRHYRLGYLPLEQLSHVLDFPSATFKSIGVFHSSTTNSNALFDLIHIDTWGSYKDATYNHYKYFLTIIDDHTRLTWTHLLTSKSNAFPILQAFIAYMCSLILTLKLSPSGKTMHQNSLLKLHCNTMLLKASHIKPVVLTPQQNGVVERKHKHLLETTTRALLLRGSTNPISFWGDYLLTTTYLINMFPLPFLNNKSPFELMFKTSPSYNYLKKFGCLCFVATLKPNRSKFHPRANPCVFIGYPFNKKAYRFLSPSAPAFVPRKSFRVSHPPVHLQDYVSYGVSSPFASNTFPSPFCNTNSFVASVLNISEPTSYKQATSDPSDRSHGQGTGSLVSKWYWKPDGYIERFKAKLVAKGFTQRQGFHIKFLPIFFIYE